MTRTCSPAVTLILQRVTRGCVRMHFAGGGGGGVRVFYLRTPRRLERSGSYSSALAKFLLLPAMSLRVYVRAHAGSIPLTQTHSHTVQWIICVFPPLSPNCSVKKHRASRLCRSRANSRTAVKPRSCSCVSPNRLDRI